MGYISYDVINQLNVINMIINFKTKPTIRVQKGRTSAANRI